MGCSARAACRARAGKPHLQNVCVQLSVVGLTSIFSHRAHVSTSRKVAAASNPGFETTELEGPAPEGPAPLIAISSPPLL